MQRLPSLLIALLLLALTNCDYQAPGKGIPFFADRVLDSLTNDKQPVKIELDMMHKQLYWLNRLGEIYRMQADGTQVELINKGIGADIGITYIEDFYLDAEHGKIYFTDLLDLESGNGAIKKSDLNGGKIETIITFPKETPLQITSRTGSDAIYYITEDKFNINPQYYLGTIRQDTHEQTLLQTSIQNLSFHQLPDFNIGSEFEPVYDHSQEIAIRQMP